MNKQIILASTSPRRKHLLQLLNLKFKVIDSGFEEKIRPGVKVELMVKELALGKAKAAAKKHKSSLIIAADTVVSLNGKILGKPHTPQKAVYLLKALSNKVHYIFSGLAILDSATGQEYLASSKTKVYFKKLTDREIREYVASKEPLDRAGAYAIQGLGFGLIEKISGDLTNAIGLPMELVYNGLKKFGVKI